MSSGSYWPTSRDINDISGLTTTNMAVGTVAYAAPEQLMGEDIDGRADQYALAATAYHLLTGTPLFDHTNPAVVISRHLTTAPPRLAQTLPELAHLDRVFTVALAKDPADRFANCGAFAAPLREAASGHSTQASLPAVRPLASAQSAVSPDADTQLAAVPPPPAHPAKDSPRAPTTQPGHRHSPGPGRG